MITAKLNLSKIDKTKLFKGKDGIYLDIVLFEKQNQYGDWVISQSLSKEERERKVQAPILGNGKNFGKPATQQSSSPPQQSFSSGSSDDLPF